MSLRRDASRERKVEVRWRSGGLEGSHGTQVRDEGSRSRGQTGEEGRCEPSHGGRRAP